jgi:hypothetical protein
MIYADVTFTDQGMIVIGGLVSALTGAVVFMFRQLNEANDQRLRDRTSERDSYKEIANEAMAALERRVNENLHTAGKQPFTAIAPVVPEHNSPVSEKQQQTADLQTLRARLTAATLALGMPARESGVPETAAQAAEHDGR